MSNRPYFDRDGAPISSEKWRKLMRDEQYPTVARAEVGDVRISTLWFGFALADENPPHIFETVVSKVSPEMAKAGFTSRTYTTLGQAEVGHVQFVEGLLAWKELLEK